MLPIVEQQDTFALVGREQDNAGCFERPANEIARRLIHLEAVFGFEAFECGQRCAGLVSERLLCPSQQRACGP